jgi:hypothetical protein
MELPASDLSTGSSWFLLDQLFSSGNGRPLLAEGQVLPRLPGNFSGLVAAEQARVRSKCLETWIQSEWMSCGMDLVYFATHYCVTAEEDPDTGVITEALVPSYPYVTDEILANFATPQDVLVEKTRQMLVSWLLCVTFLWDLLFDMSGGHNLMLSRKEKEVDDGGDASTRRSLLGKIRFMYSRLPRWMRVRMAEGKGGVVERDVLEFKLMRVHNPETGSTCVGETANPEAGRGGTWRRVGGDEFAFIPKSFQVYTAFQSGCKRGKMLVSTPNGRDNMFAVIRFTTDPPVSGFKLLTVHWTKHPDRDEEWYEKEKAKLPSKVKVAQELDINYDVSLSGKVYDLFNGALQIDPRLAFDPSRPTYVGWDFGTGCPTAIVWMQETVLGPVVLDSAEFEGTKDEEIAKAYLNRFDPSWPGYWGLDSVAQNRGDPAGKQRSHDLTSWVTKLRSISTRLLKVDPEKYPGAKPIVILGGHVYSLAERTVCGQLAMKKVRVHSRARSFLDAIQARRFPTDDQDRVVGDIPIKDWTSHTCEAWEYICQYVYPLRDIRVAKPRRRKDRRLPSHMRRPTAGLLRKEF